MGWIGRILRPSSQKEASGTGTGSRGVHGGAPHTLDQLIETSWSGKAGHQFDPFNPDGTGRARGSGVGEPDRDPPSRSRHVKTVRATAQHILAGSAKEGSSLEALSLQGHCGASPDTPPTPPCAGPAAASPRFSRHTPLGGAQQEQSMRRRGAPPASSPSSARTAPSPDAAGAADQAQQRQRLAGSSQSSLAARSAPAGDMGSLSMHRSGSAQSCNIEIAQGRGEAVRDSAASLHSPVRSRGQSSSDPLAPTPDRVRLPCSQHAQRAGCQQQRSAPPVPPLPPDAGPVPPHPPPPGGHHQRPLPAAAGRAGAGAEGKAMSCQLSKAHSEPVPAEFSLSVFFQDGQAHGEGVGGGATQDGSGDQGSPVVHPSWALLSTLSRSMPNSRDPSAHGGGAAYTACAGPELEEMVEGGMSADKGAGGRRSRRATRPLPCQPVEVGEVEGVEVGGGKLDALEGGFSALAALAALPPGDAPHAEEGREEGSRRLGGGDSFICSPGAVSLLSLQLRGGSPQSSTLQSREGSFRPLRRQLTPGGLSAALSREGSHRGGQPLSRDGSSRLASGRPLLPPHLRPPPPPPTGAPAGGPEGSGRGGSREGSFRGGAAAWRAALHPLSETGLTPLGDASHQLEGGSWRERFVTHPTARTARECRGLAPPASKQHAVDATALSAALSALAVAEHPPSLTALEERETAHRQQEEHSTRSVRSERGSVPGGVLVGDAAWATQEGGLDLTLEGLPQKGSPHLDPLDPPGSDDVAQHPEHPTSKGDWNRKFVRRWRAVKKRARIQAMGVRGLWQVDSPADRHHPDELLVDLPQNELAWPPAAGARSGASRPVALPAGRQPGGSGVRRDPSLATMLLGEVAEVT